MRLFGLIGFPLSHSFSKKYFSQKFEKEGIIDSKYDLYEIDEVSKVLELFNDSSLCGLNVTIPYKEKIIPFLDELDPAAEKIGAVNVIKIKNGKKIGFNSDYYGFKNSLEIFLNGKRPKALILGTGGASKAVKQALIDLNMDYKFVSRKSSSEVISYDQIDDYLVEYHLIINTSPVGMSPNVDSCPTFDYSKLTDNHFLYDLVYNPEETKFLRLGKENGAKIQTGLPMLVGQAEKAWQIWND